MLTALGVIIGLPAVSAATVGLTNALVSGQSDPNSCHAVGSLAILGLTAIVFAASLGSCVTARLRPWLIVTATLLATALSFCADEVSWVFTSPGACWN